MRVKNCIFKLLAILFLFIIYNPVWGQTVKQISQTEEVLRLDFWGDSCLKQGNFTSAMDAFTNSINIRKKYQNTKNIEYANVLLKLVLCQTKLRNCTNALQFGTEALTLYDKHGIIPKEHLNLIKDICEEIDEVGCYDDAKILATKFAEITQKIYGSDSYEFAISLFTQELFNNDLGLYDEAIKQGSKCIEILLKTIGSENLEYSLSLRSLSWAYCGVGNYEKAIELISEALNIIRRVVGTECRDYALSLNYLATYKYYSGYYVEAIQIQKEGLNICKKNLGDRQQYYAQALDNLATFNNELGNYDEAIRLEIEAIEIRKQIYGEAHWSYILSVNNLSMYYCSKGDYQEAIRLISNAIDICKKVLGTEHPFYVYFLNNLGGCYSMLKNYPEAIKTIEESIKITKNLFGNNHPDYALLLYNLAGYKYEVGNYEEALKLDSIALGIRQKTLGREHPDCIMSLSHYVYDNMKLGNSSHVTIEMDSLTESKSRLLLSNFGRLSTSRRNYYWQQQSPFFLVDLPKFVFNCPNANMISLLFNKTALLGKGILINTDIEMKKMIEESGDTNLVAVFQKILENYDIYDKVSLLPIAERDINTDSLKLEIQRLEDELVRKAKTCGDYMRNLKLTWKDVQSSLGDKDIAIEFLDFPVEGDSVMYVALTLKKGYDNPRMIPLFELDQLKNINKNAYYKTDRITNLVWIPLIGEMEGVENVYFSPSGELHKIGIEYLSNKNGRSLCEKYNMYRLSSTRQLALSKKKIFKKRAVLYGGIDYEALPYSLDTEMNVNSGNQVIVNTHAQIDSLSLRGSMGYLEGTKIETDTICANLEQHKWDYTYYSATKGTEKSFKLMNGNSPSLLHIATHGFYMTEADAMKERELSLRNLNMSGIKVSNYSEDKPMTRSGLLFSGCNHALNHEEIPNNEEDGILTAQEIASMDLRGLDLVVLSACETGLGDIASGEGVFGLQRGFKKAGANTIIMSLWKVSDKATQTLMTAFYKYYLDGMSKYDAFSKARGNLKGISPLRQTKPDWAAFVMLDGIK